MSAPNNDSSGSGGDENMSLMKIGSRRRAPMDVSGQQFSVFRISSLVQTGAEDTNERNEEEKKGSMNGPVGHKKSDDESAGGSQDSTTGGGLVGRRKKLLEAGRREMDSSASAISREQNDAILRHEISGDSLLRIMTENQASTNNKILTLSESGDKDGIEAIIDEATTNFKWEACRGLNNYTPLHHACSRGHGHVTSYILSVAPTLLHAMTGSDETPLHLAASSGNLLLVGQLVDRGADVDAQTKDGETPLMYAARKSLPASVRCLLGLGARAQAEDKYGDTAADYCEGDQGAYRYIALQLYELRQGDMGETENREGGKDVDAEKELRQQRALRAMLSFVEATDLSRAACVSTAWHRAASSRELWDRCGVKRWKASMDCEEMSKSGGRQPITYLAGGLRPKSK